MSRRVPSLELQVLGPVVVRVDGRSIPLSGARLIEVLCRLAVEDGRQVGSSRLLDDVWGFGQGAGVLRTTVSRLRVALGDAGDAVQHTASGYLLSADRVDIDADAFVDLVTRPRSSDPERRVTELDAALSLWRGEPYGELNDRAFLASSVRRLEMLREVALEDRYEALLQSGHDRDLIADLDRLVRQHPYRERLAESLAIALYRCGRHVDALEAVRAAASRLRVDLAIEPSERMRRLEHQVLAHDPVLLASRTRPPVSGGDRLVRLESSVRSAMVLHEMGAHGEAARVAGAAVEAARATGDGGLVVRELCRRARLLGLAELGGEGMELLAEAEALARGIDDGDALAEVAIARFHFDVGYDSRSELLSVLVEPLPLMSMQSPLRVDLLTAAVFQMAFSRDSPDVEAVLREIDRLTQWSTDPRASVLARIAAITVDHLRGTSVPTSRLMAEVDASLAELVALDDPWLEVAARLAFVGALMAEGRIDMVVESLEELDLRTRRTSVPFAWVRVRLLEVMAALATGQLEGLEDVLARIRATGDAMGVGSAVSSTNIQLLTLWLEEARHDLLRGVAAVETISDPNPRFWDVVDTAIAAIEGQPGTVDRVDELARCRVWERNLGWTKGLSLALIAEAAWRVGAVEAACVAADALEVRAGQFIVAGHSTASFGPFDRVRGLALLAVGRVDDGIGVLRRAVRQGDEGGASLWAARSQLGLACGLIQRGAPNDVAEAEQLMVEVRATRLAAHSARLARELQDVDDLLSGGMRAQSV